MEGVYQVDLVRKLYGHASDVTWVDFNSNLLATCSSDKTLRIWSFENGHEDIWELPYSPLLGHKYTVHCCCFSPSGDLLVSCSTDGNIFIWNAQSGELESSMQHPSGLGVRVCCFSPNSTLLATGGEDDTVCIWDLDTRSLLRSLEGHEATVTACTFSPDSAYLISGSNNCDLALWDARYGGNQWLQRTVEAHDLGVSGACFSPTYVLNAETKDSLNSTYLLASCGNDNIVRLWHIRTGEEPAIIQHLELLGHSANVMCCRFSPDGGLLATGAGDKTVIIWDPVQGAMLQKLERHSRYVTCCAFSYDGQFLATGSNDKTVIVWKLERDGKTFTVPMHHRDEGIKPLAIARRKSIPNKDPNAPDEYYCPITHELMKDPVIAADGYSYERIAITDWFRSGKDTSPMTNQNLLHMQVTSNLVLRMLIHRHIEENKCK